jgi:hypothetical protein
MNDETATKLIREANFRVSFHSLHSFDDKLTASITSDAGDVMAPLPVRREPL